MTRPGTSIRLHPLLLERVRALGNEYGMNRSQVIEWALAELLAIPPVARGLESEMALALCPRCERGIIANGICGVCTPRVYYTRARVNKRRSANRRK